jgi:hypothetical protein
VGKKKKAQCPCSFNIRFFIADSNWIFMKIGIKITQYKFRPITVVKQLDDFEDGLAGREKKMILGVVESSSCSTYAIILYLINKPAK